MLIGFCLQRYWLRLVFGFVFATSSTVLLASPLVIKEVPLQLHMDDAQAKQTIEQGLTPLLARFDGVAQEVEQLNQQGRLDNPSQEIVELLQLCEHWQAQLQSNFSCRLGALQREWDAAVLKSELPDRALLRSKSRQHLQLQWMIDKAGVRFSEAAISEGLQLDLQGLWQGWVLERVASEIKKIAEQKKIEYENSKLVFGNLTAAINTSAAIEQQAALIGLASITVPLNNQTLAVLDRQQHLRKVSHYPMSRLLVPKEGWPVEFAPSLLVRANNAIDASVMAQTLISVSVYDALEQVNKLANVTALAVTETGMFFASRDWYSETLRSNSPWLAQQTFSIDYEIPALDVAEYRRPYVAIWISDKSGNAVKHLQLLGDNRWLRDLRLWWRKFGRSDDALVDALVGATRKPGRYRINWDGRDGQGNKVAQGHYELHLEVVREHGEREAIVLPFELNGQVIAAETKGTKEVGRVNLALH